MPEVVSIPIEVLDYQFQDYQKAKSCIPNNPEQLSNSKVMQMMSIREDRIKQSFWALSNIASVEEAIPLLLVIQPNLYGPGSTGLDNIVNFAHLTLQIIPQKSVVIESLIAVASLLLGSTEE